MNRDHLKKDLEALKLKLEYAAKAANECHALVHMFLDELKRSPESKLEELEKRLHQLELGKRVEPPAETRPVKDTLAEVKDRLAKMS